MTSAARPVMVEPLEGRQLFAGTVDAVARDTGPVDVVSAELTLSEDGPSLPLPSWSTDLLALVNAASRLAVSRGALEFDEPPGYGLGEVETLTIHNTGVEALTMPDGGLSIEGKHGPAFQVLLPTSLPITLLPGESLNVAIVFNPGSGETEGLKTAALRIVSGDPALDERVVSLSGRAGGGRLDPWLRPIHFGDGLSDPRSPQDRFAFP